MMVLLGDGLRSVERYIPQLRASALSLPSPRRWGYVRDPPPPLFVLVVLELLSLVFAKLNIYSWCYERCYKAQIGPLAGQLQRCFIHGVEYLYGRLLHPSPRVSEKAPSRNSQTLRCYKS